MSYSTKIQLIKRKQSEQRFLQISAYAFLLLAGSDSDNGESVISRPKWRTDAPSHG